MDKCESFLIGIDRNKPHMISYLTQRSTTTNIEDYIQHQDSTNLNGGQGSATLYHHIFE